MDTAKRSVIDRVKSYEWIAHIYDAVWKYGFTSRHVLRDEAIARLELKKGDIVIDCGCGTGLNLSSLADAVGDKGNVYAFDQSDAMTRKARRAIRKDQASRVEVSTANATDFSIPDKADALLLYYVPDIISTPAAVNNLISLAKSSAKIVAVGPKCPRNGKVKDGVVFVRHWLFIKNMFALLFPYTYLLNHLDDYTIEERMGKTEYVLVGQVKHGMAL